MLHINFNNVFVASTGTVAGKKEKEGPLGNLFDKSYSNNLLGLKSYETAEAQMMKEANTIALNKLGMKLEDIDILIAGDLNNQIACSSKVSGLINSSFLGVYGACSTSMLATLTGSILVDNGIANNVLVSSTSSFATAERQFRYPIEYGGQKKFTTTYTVTGSGAMLLSSNTSDIKITEGTFGQTFDPNWTDVNDMGSAMSYAAYNTIKSHLLHFNHKANYYDAIITGDLSSIGSKILYDMFKSDGVELNNHLDCGNLIFDREKQNVFAGGSGAACCPLVTYTKIFNELRKGKYKKVLVVATGALHDPIYVFQKKSIPVIAHAVTFERSEE